MKNSKKILLLSTDTSCSASLEGPLLVAGYDLVIKKNLDEAISLSRRLKTTPRRFDLLIAEKSDEENEQLKKLVQKKVVSAFLRVYCQDLATEPYSIKGNEGCVYQYSALLAAVKEVLANVEADAQFENSEATTRSEILKKFDNFVA